MVQSRGGWKLVISDVHDRAKVACVLACLLACFLAFLLSFLPLIPGEYLSSAMRLHLDELSSEGLEFS